MRRVSTLFAPISLILFALSSLAADTAQVEIPKTLFGVYKGLVNVGTTQKEVLLILRCNGVYAYYAEDFDESDSSNSENTLFLVEFNKDKFKGAYCASKQEVSNVNFGLKFKYKKSGRFYYPLDANIKDFVSIKFKSQDGVLSAAQVQDFTRTVPEIWEISNLRKLEEKKGWDF